MEEIKKMLRAVINAQSALREEFLGQIAKVRQEIGETKEDVRNAEKRLTARIDKIGKTVAYMEDDTPTRQEYNAPKNF